MGEILAMKKIRLTALALIALTQAACTGAGGPSAFSRPILGSDGPKIASPAAQLRAAEAQGAPTMKVIIEDRNTEGDVLRIVRRGDITTWLSRDNVSLTFEDGLLIGTRGMGRDLMSADVAQSASLIAARKTGPVTRAHGYLDGEDDIVIHGFDCRIEDRGPRRIDFNGTPRDTLLMAERCKGAAGNFLNFYWTAAESGKILQSRQWVGPEIGAILQKHLPGR